MQRAVALIIYLAAAGVGVFVSVVTTAPLWYAIGLAAVFSMLGIIGAWMYYEWALERREAVKTRYGYMKQD